MILKMNSLEDQGMIDKLYQASQAGVKIQLIIRGICCLVPGVEGMSENIEITSIVDRFLEHARVYIFANGGQEIIYCASADWMTRNLYRRVEVAFPIYQEDIREEIRTIINLQLEDNTKARIIDENQSNRYVERAEEAPLKRAQVDVYELLKSKIQ
jgi:polyphosphate kinase